MNLLLLIDSLQHHSSFHYRFCNEHKSMLLCSLRQSLIKLMLKLLTHLHNFQVIEKQKDQYKGNQQLHYSYH